MLKLKHREEVTEERIREDERRKVMSELHGNGRADRHDDMDGDWRNTPPAADEPRFDDPRDRADDRDDPRAWDVADERATQRREMVDDDRRRSDVALEQRPWTAQEETVTEKGFSPGQILVILAGVASLVLGIMAVARTGLDGSLSDPVKPVFGWNHTALLGLIEIGAGAVMVLSGLRAGSRWLGGLVGVAAIVGGALILGGLDWTVTHLGAEKDFGWVAIVIGAVAVLGALIPRVRRHHRRTTTESSAPMATY